MSKSEPSQDVGPSLGKRKDRYGSDNARNPKKQRKDGKEKDLPVPDDKPVIERNPPKASLLQQEEKSFPRGGSSVLTPLERKQIQIQATKDVLFEESGQKRTKEDASSDDEFSRETKAEKPTVSKKRKTFENKRKGIEGGDPLEPRARTDGLKPSRLTPGCMVLGMVSKIKANEISLDLPNCLRGTVSITAISKTITEGLQALAAAEENGEAQDNDLDIDLQKCFLIGQYIRACVTENPKDSDGAHASRSGPIQLSLDPRRTNQGLAKSDIGINTMVQASIVSVEDHGLVMDLGIADGSLKGFMSSKEIPEDIQYSDLRAGAVFLCLVTGMSSNGNVIKLSANLKKAQKFMKSGSIPQPPTVKSLLPGFAVEVLVSLVSASSISGKIMGSVDVSADIVHSGAFLGKFDLESKYTPGTKIKARIIFCNPESENDTIGVSVLDHVLSLTVRQSQHGKSLTDPIRALPKGSSIKQAKILNVEPNLGVYADVGIKGVPTFVHISKVSDERVPSLSKTTEAYKRGKTHAARILDYNSVDGTFIASFEKSIIEQKYLQVEDIPVGELLQATVEKIVINPKGVAGLLLNVDKGIHGFVPETHMSDVHLQHPELKFKKGLAVDARVLSVNNESRQVLLTLKKTLVTTDMQIWTNYENIKTGSASVGTIVKIKPEGAIVQFFGRVKAFLPVSEMSDAFIDDPSKHFRLGQTVKVHVLSIDPSKESLTVTCRIRSSSNTENVELAKLKIGSLVEGVVVGKSSDDITLELKDSKLKASLHVDHLKDGSERKSATAMNQIRVGQTIKDLLILEIFPKKQSVILSKKKSLIKDAKDGKFLAEFKNINPGMNVNGFVRGITEHGVFVGFGNGLSGLLHKTNLTESMKSLPDFGLRKGQSIAAKISYVDYPQSRFTLTMKDMGASEGNSESAEAKLVPAEKSAISPVDGTSSSLGDFVIGKLTTAKVSSVKTTQLNVRLATNVQGRIDVSEAFSKWEDIKDRKNPLRTFRVDETIPVRILGIHDARNHRFLPISHRSGKVPVFELSAKVSHEKSLLSLDQLTVGSWITVFVNNITDHCVWVNASPNVRGRIERMDISEDVSLLNDLETNFPVGSALRVRVKNIDLSNNRLDLSAKGDVGDVLASLDSLTVGMITTGRITKTTERSVVVQLGLAVVGTIGLSELSDDFSKADPGMHQKNEIIRVCVLDVDKPNKRVTLSTRPSKVLSSSLKVDDRHISGIDQLKVNDIVRGFVRSVTDAGLFVSLSHNVTAYVRVSDLSDSYIKDWKASVEVDQLVTGKVTNIDMATKQVQMSLKSSVVSKDYIPRITFNDLTKGQVVTAKVRKVEEFGAFLVVDNSHNVSGLCHRSEMAEKNVPDARKIYEEGDLVKAIVLKIEPEKRRISFGLKASYFDDGEDQAAESDEAELSFSGDARSVEDDESEEGGIEIPLDNDMDVLDDLVQSSGDDDEVMSDMEGPNGETGLNAGGFDWNGAIQQDQDDKVSEAPSETDPPPKASKKQQRRAEIQIDHTGDLDTLGPRSADDFERLLLGQRDSSSLWVQYMAFYLQLSEIESARKVGERALKEINIREQEEKMNVWVALLNLENAYGSDDTIEEIFSRACEFNDAQEMHERLTSIYIESGKHKKADDLFQSMAKKKTFTTDPKLWLNYANFVMGTLGEPDRSRAMLDRAVKSVPSHLHRDLVSKFAQLEFRCKNGDPERGRTMFERLFDTYPKRWDLWDILIGMETLQGERANVRALHERMTSMKMKTKRAKYSFKKWLEFEEVEGDQKRIDHVKAKTAEYVAQQKSREDGEDTA